MKTPASNKRADWLPGALAEIEALRTLQANWDSYGAAPVHPLSIEKACLLVEYLAAHPKVGVPSIGASGDGYVGFSWDEDDWSLDVEVLPGPVVMEFTYVYLDPQDDTKDAVGVLYSCRDLLRFFG